MLRGSLRRTYSQFDLLMLGLGIVVGSGVFTLTGQGSALFAGSAIMISYIIMGITVSCAAACYSELCVEYPVAGSAFTYTMVTFGEFPAYITMGMLLVQYILGMAAVARGWSAYLALLCNQPASLFVFEAGDWSIDVMAFGVVIILSLTLSSGSRESSNFINVITCVKLFFIVFICIGAYTRADAAAFADNFGLPDKGPEGVIQGAALVLFSFVAFDAVCNAVEEAQLVAHIPPAIIGTVGISTAMYVLLAIAMVLMATPEQLKTCTNDRGDILAETGPAIKCGTTCLTDNGRPIYPGATVPAWQLGYVFSFNLQCELVGWEGVGRRLSERWQRVLAVGHMLLINGVCIGEFRDLESRREG